MNQDGQIDVADCLGETGEQGPRGDDGTDGTNGLDGANCYDNVGDVNQDGQIDANDCLGGQGEQGPQGDSGVLGLDIINDSTSWMETEESQVYETTLACEVPGQVALSVGVSGAGAMNNVVSMAIEGLTQGYYRIRIKGGSAASEVEAQLVCATVG